MEFPFVNLMDLIESTEDESVVEAALSVFSCQKNEDIEYFLKNKKRAIDFAKRKVAMTYIVLDDDGNILGYFTITNKAVDISPANLSKSSLKKLKNLTQDMTENGDYRLSAYLIAQFGLNDSTNRSVFNGDMLMSLALGILKYIQHIIGGGVVFLECENNEKLLEFYQREPNNFRYFGDRVSPDGVIYKRLLKFI